MRSIWQGTLSFGLVSIPVKLYSASEDRDPRMHYLHRDCNQPVRYKKVCSACGVDVPEEELALGHEYAPGQYVVVEKEELQSLGRGAAQDRRIEILQFPTSDELDAVYFLKPYFLEPQKGGHRAYQLLREALSEANRVALCRLSLRQRPRLATLRPYHDGALLLETMHAPDEVRDVEDLELGPAVTPSEPELHLAQALIETLAGRFVPKDHTDEYRDALEQLLQRKAEVAPQPVEAPVGEDMDALLERLRMSLTGAAH
ncbi:MAG: Ku protein [Thermaerobacter sp.]|nr:Ku protein [Thermaerobacter sp.]